MSFCWLPEVTPAATFDEQVLKAMAYTVWGAPDLQPFANQIIQHLRERKKGLGELGGKLDSNFIPISTVLQRVRLGVNNLRGLVKG
jgi:hypothetical protein